MPGEPVADRASRGPRRRARADGEPSPETPSPEVDSHHRASGCLPGGGESILRTGPAGQSARPACSRRRASRSPAGSFTANWARRTGAARSATAPARASKPRRHRWRCGDRSRCRSDPAGRSTLVAGRLGRPGQQRQDMKVAEQRGRWDTAERLWHRRPRPRSKGRGWRKDYLAPRQSKC